MKKEWKQWFIDNVTIEREHGEYNWEDRRYMYINIYKDLVPFHEELREYIFSLNSSQEPTDYDTYHIHYWNEGDFFSEHIDNNFKRRWAYVCELHPSDCNTSLLVEGKPLKEGLFDSNTKHEVPKIKMGTRISLTVFGSLPNSLI